MKPSTYKPNIWNNGTAVTAHQRGSSPDTSTVRTIILAKTTSLILVTCETTAARVTIDGTDPSAASAPSMVVQKDTNALPIPIGTGNVVKWCSTAAAASVLQVAELD